MATLPQLLEEDILQLDDALSELLKQTDATTALVIDKAGFLITQHGDARQFDLTTIAALASGAYMANQTIFQASVSVGAIKYFATPAADKIAKQLKIAHERDPSEGLDLSMLNLADPSEVFKRKLA